MSDRRYLQIKVQKSNNWRYVVHVYHDDVAHSPQKPMNCFIDKYMYIRAMFPQYQVRIAKTLDAL